MGGDVGVGLAVEVIREGFKELVVDCLSLGYGRCLWCSCGVGQGVEDSGVVLDEDCGYGLCCFVVLVQAAEGVFEVAVFHNPESGEAHCYAEHYDSEAADGGYEFFSAGFDIVLLPLVEGGVEVGFLLGGEVECDVVTFFEDVEEVLVFFAEGLEVVFKGLVAGVGEDVVPDEFGVEVVEGES